MDFSFLNTTDAVIDLNADLSRYTTFRLGGPCPCVVTCADESQLEKVVCLLNKNKQKFILIGSGSNLLVSDEGIDFVILRYVNDSPNIQREGNNLIVSGSTSIDALAQFAIQNSLDGINYVSGIPGTVGGAIAGNAGAFGKQIGDCLLSVVLLSKEGKKHEVSPKSLGLRYRYSNIKETGDIVLSVRLSLKAGNQERLMAKRQEILATRRLKHPDLDNDPCAGSFFRNIESAPGSELRQAAGWFLDKAGAKSMHVGGAAVFPKHANIIVRTPECKAQDVFDLSKLMQNAVEERYNISLIREVRLVGKFHGMPTDITADIW